ncbi:MAG TPA: hypothetical protein VL327_00325 [Pyrinomonadaceae bacterium]|jgi:hypothetical protein|nr:hypothetical protein [Pyrinomonadaceae bacterium]
MFRNFFIFLFLISCILFGAAVAEAQAGADGGPIFGNQRDREPEPKSIKEMMFRMQLDKEKKDYDEMLERGEQALNLSKEIEKSYDKTGALTESDREKLGDIEKLVKKIRGELGGEGDDRPDSDADNPKDVVTGVKYLAKSTADLVDELKKTTRLSISAAAIESSNTVLGVLRFLRLKDK